LIGIRGSPHQDGNKEVEVADGEPEVVGAEHVDRLPRALELIGEQRQQLRGCDDLRRVALGP
jgi:hypothetical protein